MEPTIKRCNRCREVQPLENFNRHSRSSDGHQGYCRPCQAEKQREYRTTAAGKARDKRYESSDKKTDVWKRYRAKPEVAEAIRVRRNEWSRGNPRVLERAKVAGGKRRALKRATMVEPFTARELHAYWDSIGAYACVYCSKPYEHADHVIPLSRGGTHTLTNLVPACADCNLSKGARCPWEFVASLYP